MLSCIAKMFRDKIGTRIWSHFTDFHQFFVYVIEIEIRFSSLHIYIRHIYFALMYTYVT